MEDELFEDEHADDLADEEEPYDQDMPSEGVGFPVEFYDSLEEPDDED